jgi:hypothetical protein
MTDRRSGYAKKRREAQEVARRMLRDPQFRYDVVDQLDEERGKRPCLDRRLEQARSMFEIGDEQGQIWIWINGLNTFGIGDSFFEAYSDALDEIGMALYELWDARRA